MNEIYKERVQTTCTASVYTLQVLSFCLFKRLFSSAAVDRITQEREIQGPYDIWIWNDGKKITIIFFNNYAINYIRTHQMATHQMPSDGNTSDGNTSDGNRSDGFSAIQIRWELKVELRSRTDRTRLTEIISKSLKKWEGQKMNMIMKLSMMLSIIHIDKIDILTLLIFFVFHSLLFFSSSIFSNFLFYTVSCGILKVFLSCLSYSFLFRLFLLLWFITVLIVLLVRYGFHSTGLKGKSLQNRAIGELQSDFI